MENYENKRFSVERDNCGAFAIVDKDNEKYRMPRRAVSIYFKHENDALAICHRINVEWDAFCIHPW